MDATVAMVVMVVYYSRQREKREMDPSSLSGVSWVVQWWYEKSDGCVGVVQML